MKARHVAPIARDGVAVELLRLRVVARLGQAHAHIQRNAFRVGLYRNHPFKQGARRLGSARAHVNRTQVTQKRQRLRLLGQLGIADSLGFIQPQSANQQLDQIRLEARRIGLEADRLAVGRFGRL